MRVVFFSALIIFLSVGVCMPGQDLARREAPTLRVGASADLAAAQQPMQAPILGFVATSAGKPGHAHHTAVVGLSSGTTEVRAILGVPGAALLSSPLVFPRGTEHVYFAPGQNFGLAQRSGAVAVFQISSGQVASLQALSGALASADMVAFNPGGSAAAIFSEEEGRLQIVAGLPGSPQVSHNLSAAELPANIRMLALADDGVTLLAGIADGSVLALHEGKAAQLLYSANDLGGIAFEPSVANALLFDRTGARLLLLENASTAPSTRVLAEGLAGVSGEVALQFDGPNAIVGALKAKQISRINLQTLQVDTVATPVALTMMQPLLAAHRFLISSESGQPAWILDTSTAAAAVYFVPRETRPVLAR
jgi:hypothetical protein